MLHVDHGSWIKIFEDGTKEHGSDLDIQEGKASWSRGRLENIIEVLLCDHSRSVSLSVPNTNWHQFDRYVAPIAVGADTSFRTHRVVQAEIKESHVGRYVIGSLKDLYFCWAMVEDKPHTAHDYNRRIEQEDVGKWITIILKIHETTFVRFSSRGKL